MTKEFALEQMLRKRRAVDSDKGSISPVAHAVNRPSDDFLSRATEQEVRERVRQTVEICQPGGGFALGSGNSVANYIPLDNYLAMLDEGRRLSG